MGVYKPDDPCPCGSGRRYQECCLQHDQTRSALAAKKAALASALQSALLRHQAGDLQRAESIYRQIIQVAPDHPDALHLLGLIAHQGKKSEQAIELIRKAIAADPSNPYFHFNLGFMFNELGRYDQAAGSLRTALALKPDYAEAHFQLGVALHLQDKLDEAIACYRQALSFKPDHAGAQVNLGAAFHHQGKLNEAAACYRQALSFKPDNAEAYNYLGNVLQKQCRQDEAIACFRRALSFRPDYAEARWGLTVSQLPGVYVINQDPQACRTAFSSQLDELDAWFGPERIDEGFTAVGVWWPFHLAYQEVDNRSLLSRHGALCNRLMQHWQRLQGYQPSRTVTPGRIRIGIVSQYIHDHAVWHALIKGWLRHLDRSRFDLHIFYLGTIRDMETRFAQALAASLVEGRGSLSGWAEAILERQLDVLIYPEIGMDPLTIKLASLRLAPVQMTSWGHPETSGLPTMDYFISAEDLEPADAGGYYTEKLVKLPHLGCYYERLAVVPDAAGPALPGIGRDCPLLLCAGSPFKYAPQFDWVYAEIAQSAGPCRLVFFNYSVPEMSEVLQQRLKHAFVRAGVDYDEYVTFIPWQSRPAFYGLMKRADVYLDTIGFSGFNTAMQAVECGLPIVTREGRFMRGRFASGILKRMGLSDLVVATEKDYVALAARLARDPEYRQSVSERMKQACHELFVDLEPIRAFENFLMDVTHAA